MQYCFWAIVLGIYLCFKNIFPLTTIVKPSQNWLVCSKTVWIDWTSCRVYTSKLDLRKLRPCLNGCFFNIQDVTLVSTRLAMDTATFVQQPLTTSSSIATALTVLTIWSHHRGLFPRVTVVGLFYQIHLYRPQRSCEGYVFTGVCLSTGGSASVHAGKEAPPGRMPQCMLGRKHPPGRMPQYMLGRKHPPTRDGWRCRRYASYWNTFLLRISFTMG